MKQAVQKLVVSKRFQMVTTAVIILNAIILGVMTAPLPDAARAVLGAIDTACLAFYVVEIALRIYAAGPAFFKNAWNTFDFVIVVLSIIPTEILPVPVQIARILRIFRMLRVFRLVSAFDQLRVIVAATVKSIPGVLWTAFLMLMVQYVYAIIGVSVFADDLPQYFGNLGRSMFTLFEVMTLEGWNGVADDTMAVFPWAWGYFMSFVIISAFVLMNVVVGVIVNAVDEGRQSINAALDDQDGTDDELLAVRLRELQSQMDEVSRLLADRQRREGRG